MYFGIQKTKPNRQERQLGVVDDGRSGMKKLEAEKMFVEGCLSLRI
jgi:hypothetical protein